MLQDLYFQGFLNISISDVSPNFVAVANNAKNKLRQEILKKSNPVLAIIDNEDDDKIFENLAQKIKKYSQILLLGVGGSSLGAKTICALNPHCKIEFLESIDPQTIDNVLSKIDLGQCFFLIVSKSGETVETICQSLIIIDKLQKINLNSKDFSSRFLFITADFQSSLAKIANKISAPIIPHPANIGGRYSVFSVIGILPALIADLDIKKFRRGAKKAIEDFISNSQITDACAIQLELYNRGFCNNVFMPYVDILKNFTDWYRQLLAESLGKNGYGATPINSMGTVDQHSQLQLYLEGKSDKFFTFISNKKNQKDFAINDLDQCQTLFGRKNLSQILEIEKNTTIEVLRQKKLPIRNFEINEVNEESLGALMMQMFLEIMTIAYAKNIDPFNQPAVELRKDLAKKILSNFL